MTSEQDDEKLAEALKNLRDAGVTPYDLNTQTIRRQENEHD